MSLEFSYCFLYTDNGTLFPSGWILLLVYFLVGDLEKIIVSNYWCLGRNHITSYCFGRRVFVYTIGYEIGF